jgi:nucleoside-diphosphate-sugar epimerase
MENAMRKLVVTGSSGFVGRRLVNMAQDEGYEVIGIDLVSDDSLSCKQFVVDLNKDNIANLIPEGSTVIHLASLSTDSLCRENPILALDSNVTATARLMKFSANANASQFIFASSEWVYPELVRSELQFETDSLDLLNLNSLYAMSKQFGESVIRATAEIPYWLLRFGIVYGPRKNPGSAPESLALKVFRGESIEVGSFSTSRRFIYIDDLVRGILAAVNAGPDKASNIPINIAGAELISLRNVVDTAGEILNLPVVFSQGSSAPSIRNPDITRARGLLDWEPKVSFRVGLKDCLEEMQGL